jgi:hypothetical protein
MVREAGYGQIIAFVSDYGLKPVGAYFESAERALGSCSGVGQVIDQKDTVGGFLVLCEPVLRIGSCLRRPLCSESRSDRR